ncbi:glycosyltransferase family 1 protein, partial [Candidatus Bathyarchaeota archaeon]
MIKTTIAHVSTNYLPTIGGIELAIKNLSDGLVGQGFNVRVISSLQDKTNIICERLGQVNVVRVPSLRFFYNELTVPYKIPIKALKDVDIVVGWAGSSFFPYPICREAKKLGKKIIAYIIGVDYLRNHHNTFVKILGYPYQKILTEKWLETSHLVLVTNEFERKLLNEVYRVNSVILPHGVSRIYVETPKLDEIFREKYNLERDEKILAYIGRIHPTKGVDVLI